MKKMKKLFAVLLTLAMVLGMSMTSFAAETSYTSEIKVTGYPHRKMKLLICMQQLH